MKQSMASIKTEGKYTVVPIENIKVILKANLKVSNSADRISK